MERIPILKMYEFLLVTVQVDMHDRLALMLQDDLTERIVETHPWLADTWLVMHSDGLLTRWDLNAHPGLKVRHPSLIAGVLLRHFARGRDGVTVVVAKAVPTA